MGWNKDETERADQAGRLAVERGCRLITRASIENDTDTITYSLGFPALTQLVDLSLDEAELILSKVFR